MPRLPSKTARCLRRSTVRTSRRTRWFRAGTASRASSSPPCCRAHRRSSSRRPADLDPVSDSAPGTARRRSRTRGARPCPSRTPRGASRSRWPSSQGPPATRAPDRPSPSTATGTGACRTRGVGRVPTGRAGGGVLVVVGVAACHRGRRDHQQNDAERRAPLNGKISSGRASMVGAHPPWFSKVRSVRHNGPVLGGRSGGCAMHSYAPLGCCAAAPHERPARTPSTGVGSSRLPDGEGALRELDGERAVIDGAWVCRAVARELGTTRSRAPTAAAVSSTEAQG